jgi:hypothetical protein
VKKRFKIWMQSLSWLFVFRKPQLHAFHCIDLVADNRQLFLMVWDTAHARRICVQPGRHVYKASSGAAVITLLPGTKQVEVRVSNCWRRVTMTIMLKHISLDPVCARLLDIDFQMFYSLSLLRLESGPVIKRLQINLGEPSIKIADCVTHINPQYKYQNLYYHHEP